MMDSTIELIVSLFNLLATHTKAVRAQSHVIVLLHEFDKSLIASLAYCTYNGTYILNQLINSNFGSAQEATFLLSI
jgi:hypothetical protein